MRSVTDVEWVRPPLVPVMVSVKVPRFTCPFVVTVSVELDVAGFGLNEPDERFGRPLTPSDTDPLKPLTGVIVTA